LINKKKCLAVIPARGGSRRLKRKNIKEFNGKPLIGWSIIEALKSKYIDRLVVSTEDEEIAEIAKSFGASVPYLRPSYLSQDDVGATEPILELLKNFNNYDQIVLLQPTSPLRLYKDIDACIKISNQQKGYPCIAVSEVVHDIGVLVTKDIKNKISLYKNKDNNKVLKINGAIYTSSAAILNKHKTFITNNALGYEMPIDRSIDIDTIHEFRLAENYMKSENNDEF
jgi:CMP-N,N'-diacetyllegionaminic acid synthase